MGFLKAILINFILLILLLEGGSFLYFTLGLGASNYRPSYVSNAHDTEEEWMTEYNPWGAWHKINGRGFKERRCFSVNLIANSYGARDIERKVQSPKSRVIVLGDSFAEGYGVDQSERFSEKLAKKTNREFLNFGASGNFGPLQYAILYEKLASKFDHDAVLIAVLPDNDFTDNDPDVWRKADKVSFERRYRPYWQKNEATNDFSYYYPVKKPNHELTFADYRSNNQSRSISLKNRLQRLTWTYGLYREIRYFTRRSTLEAGVYSGYFDYNDDQLASTLFYLKKIKDEAGNKPVTFFTIPRLSDLQRLKDQTSSMVQKMQKFADETGLTYIDLAPEMQNSAPDIRDLFLACDGHWSPKGHSVAAEILFEHVYQK
jgi:hypothetical protein